MKLLTKSLLLLIVTSLNVLATTTNNSVIKNYSKHVHVQYKESLNRALDLQKAITQFTAAPSQITQDIAKAAWINAREVYGQTEAFRFYSGPIDSDEGPEGLLNAWPLDEVYIDYVVGLATAGIINNIEEYPAITKEVLISLNELDGEKNISTGYHAIEFLLWGQDLFDLGAGRRAYTDYVVGESLNADRRATYLNIVAELLIEHLSYLESQWDEQGNNYRAEFESLDEKNALKNILTGLIYMSGDELSGERMYVAYDTMGQEDEHSCFSDMTHMDILWNYQGVENVIVSTNILELLGETNQELAQSIMSKLNSTKSSIKNIPVPFDQAIISTQGRSQILNSVEELESLAKDLVNLSQALGAKVEF